MKGLCIIVSLVPLKISLLLVKVLPNTRMYRFLVILRNQDSPTAHYGIFCILHPYKIQFTQQLKSDDQSQRRRCVEWVLEQQTGDGNFSNKVFFSDEAHFTLDVYANKKNIRIWGFGNPQVIKRGHYIQKKSLFGALYGPKV